MAKKIKWSIEPGKPARFEVDCTKEFKRLSEDMRIIREIACKAADIKPEKMIPTVAVVRILAAKCSRK